MATNTPKLDPRLLRAQARRFLALAAEIGDDTAKARLIGRAELLDRTASSIEDPK